MIDNDERSHTTRDPGTDLFLQRWGSVLSESQRKRVRAASQQDARVVRLLPPALLALGLVLWGFGASAARVEQVSDLGLVSALPLLWWVGVGLVAVAFVVEVSNTTVRVPMLALCVVGLVFALHATPLWIQEEPRFATAWLHVGFSDYIGQTGDTLPQLDARMSWPGFFSATGMLARAMGVDDRWFLLLATVVFNLAYLIPLKALANSQLRTERARWTTLWIFVAANWVGQDYFAPQAVNFFLMVSVFAIVGSVFSGRSEMSGRRGRGARSSVAFTQLARLVGRAIAAPAWARPAERVSSATDEGARLVWLGIVCLIFASMVVSHQLTPIAVVGCLTVLVLFDRTTARGLPLIFAVLAITWLSWGAVDYWQGHLDSLFGGFGRLGNSFDQNVNERLTGSADRLLVLRSRILLGVAVWVAAMIGLALRWRRGYQHLAMASLLLAPFGVIVAQSYGGEAVLRVFLYTLPAACVLVAAPIAERAGVGRRNDIAVRLAPVAFVLLAVFPLARWGNERFERVTSAEVEAVDWVSANVPHGSTLISLNFNLPWRYRDLASYDYREGSETPDDWLDYLDGEVADAPGPPWVILTRGQGNYGEMESGYEPGWMDRLRSDMVASGRYEVAYENQDASILCVVGMSCDAGGSR